MDNNIIKTYKIKNRIICYIKKSQNEFKACTGKPSDISCLSWSYNTLEEAEKTALEYYNNYLKKN